MAARPAGPGPVPGYHGLNHVPQLHRWSSSPREAAGVGRAARPVSAGLVPVQEEQTPSSQPLPCVHTEKTGPAPQGRGLPRAKQLGFKPQGCGILAETTPLRPLQPLGRLHTLSPDRTPLLSQPALACPEAPAAPAGFQQG